MPQSWILPPSSEVGPKWAPSLKPHPLAGLETSGSDHMGYFYLLPPINRQQGKVPGTLREGMGGASRFLGWGAREGIGRGLLSSEVRFQEEDKHCTRFCQVCDPVRPLLLPLPLRLALTRPTLPYMCSKNPVIIFIMAYNSLFAR